MAGLRVEVLAVVTGTLLLVCARDWERIDEAPLRSFYATGRWGEPSGVTLPDDSDDYDGEDAVPEVEGAATIDNLSPFADHGFQVENSDPWPSSTGSGFQVEFVDAPPRSWTSSTCPSSAGLAVVCSGTGFKITLPTDQLSKVKILGKKDLSVMEAPEFCGYVNTYANTLYVPFHGCNVNNTDGHSLQLSYVNEFGQTEITTASCKESQNLDPDLFPRASNQPQQKCSKPTTALPQTSKAQNCSFPTGERVTCGHSGITSSDCEKMGCCVDSSTSACYYPMDECTGDQHFVFAIRHNSASIPVDPTQLVIPGNKNCGPVIVNAKAAIFKFKVTECGTHAYEVGETKIYLAEVQPIVKAWNLKYGVITRTDPLRFMVECRYSKEGIPQQSLASIGYMVKVPSSALPSSVISNGLYGVQLRIAKDKSFSSYFPTYHQPLRLLLGNPVYLELLLLSPKQDAVILVNYCLAYPRSAKNALVLIYEGCANPYDPNVSILKVMDLPKNRYQRRFAVNTFQFMDQKTNKYLDEEIYFMCSAEVCMPLEKTCEQRCFDGKVP